MAVRDLQALLLQSMFQTGGPRVEDARVVTLAMELLPLFAALRLADRGESARMSSSVPWWGMRRGVWRRRGVGEVGSGCSSSGDGAGCGGEVTGD